MNRNYRQLLLRVRNRHCARNRDRFRVRVNRINSHTCRLGRIALFNRLTVLIHANVINSVNFDGIIARFCVLRFFLRLLQFGENFRSMSGCLCVRPFRLYSKHLPHTAQQNRKAKRQ